MSIAAASVIGTIRREQRAERERLKQIELPGDPKAVLQPGKARTESIRARRHEHFALRAQRREQVLELSQVVASPRTMRWPG